MKTSNKILIYSFILLLFVYSAVTTYYMFIQVKNQYHTNNDIKSEITSLNNKIEDLGVKQNIQNQELSQITTTLGEMTNKIQSLAPESDKIAYYQISTLINTANQSLLLQDTTTTISLLNYAIQFLDSVHQLIFAQLKNSIEEDINYLQSNTAYDSSFVLIKITSLNKSIDTIFSNRLIQLRNINNNAVNSMWSKFITNTKNTLFKFWEKNIKTAEQDDLVYKRMQLDVMNMKHAVLIHDENLWQNSVNDIIMLGKNGDLSENEFGSISAQLQLMLTINIGFEKNLDHTMDALNKISHSIHL